MDILNLNTKNYELFFTWWIDEGWNEKRICILGCVLKYIKQSVIYLFNYSLKLWQLVYSRFKEGKLTFSHFTIELYISAILKIQWDSSTQLKHVDIYHGFFKNCQTAYIYIVFINIYNFVVELSSDTKQHCKEVHVFHTNYDSSPT